jgi:hypothetical protein
MSSIRYTRLGATMALALSLSLLPETGHAYTQEEQQACQPDAFRLCSSEIPDIDRVTACMVAKKSQLSPECRRFFRSPDPPPPSAASQIPPPGRPLSIKPAATTAKKATATAKKPKPKKTTKPAAT